MRELVEETGVEADAVSSLAQPPVYVEYGQVPARPDKDEPEHYHLDFGYAFTTAHAEIGHIQESEVTGAGWYPLPVAEHLVGPASREWCTRWRESSLKHTLWGVLRSMGRGRVR